ncbi:hypothetical protein [Clostridium sp.]|uniref:hypothetical protein n=1 Tax=Clostridium sp. TaxID=1506 RepID=UPI0032171906
MNNHGVPEDNWGEEEYNFENEINYYDEGYEECIRCGNRDCVDNKKLCSYCNETWE